MDMMMMGLAAIAGWIFAILAGIGCYYGGQSKGFAQGYALGCKVADAWKATADEIANARGYTQYKDGRVGIGTATRSTSEAQGQPK